MFLWIICIFVRIVIVRFDFEFLFYLVFGIVCVWFVRFDSKFFRLLK